MTRDDIIRIAREAGWTGPEENVTYVAMLEQFAALIAAAEREACFKETYDVAMKAAEAGIDKAMELEREACAQVCDGWLHADGDRCAEAIRARGQA